MSIEIIGKNISSLRKERGFKQEELARAVGVSTQAVSKWENGGVPDVDLLPAIADFFGVSIDSLFGRNTNIYCDIDKALVMNIAETPYQDKMKKAFDFCWDIERALYPNLQYVSFEKVEDCQKDIGEEKQAYSSMMNNYGFTRMGLGNHSQYFLLVPNQNNPEKAYLDGIDYPTFFKDFSDKDTFEAFIMLDKRGSRKAFTNNYLVNNMGITSEKADEMLSILKKYNIIYSENIEMDDETITIYKYSFDHASSFAALLIFAHEMIERPRDFYYLCGGREKPYLS